MPQPRVRGSQRTCSAVCRAKQQERTQRAWRERNPGYSAERRLRAQTERLTKAREPPSPGDSPPFRPLRPPPRELKEIPWEYACETFGIPGAVLLVFMLRLTFRATQSAIRVQQTESARESGTQAAVAGIAIPVQQMASQVQLFENGAESGSLPSPAPQRLPLAQMASPIQAYEITAESDTLHDSGAQMASPIQGLEIVDESDTLHRGFG